MKNICWSEIVVDLLFKMKITQIELAEMCNVTEQTISRWKNEQKFPGVYGRDKLRNLAAEANLNIDDYKINSLDSCVKGQPGFKLPEDVLAFSQRISVLSKREKQKVLQLGEFLVKMEK